MNKRYIFQVLHCLNQTKPVLFLKKLDEELQKTKSVRSVDP